MISLIAAMDMNRNIGLNGDMPWGKEMKADLRHFKHMTEGKAVIMGRKTFESIGHPLPNRFNIILSRNAEFACDIRGKKMLGLDPTYNNTTVLPSIEEFFQLAKLSDIEEYFVIGGATLYEQFMPYADRIELTKVHAHLDGDTKFPSIVGNWKTYHGALIHLNDNKYLSQYITFERVK